MGLICTHQSDWVDNTDYSSVTQADTLVSPAAHFWDMHENTGATQITDIVAGSVVSPFVAATRDGAFLTLLGDQGGTATGQALITDGVALGTSDWMFLVSGRAVAGTPAEDCGHLGFYWMLDSVFDIRVHPYYITINNGLRTLPYPPNWVRTAGQIYTHAAVKRGTVIEHYALPRGFIDSVDLANEPSFDQLGTLDYAAPTHTYMGHGGYGTPYNYGAGRLILGSPWPVELGSSSGEVGQDFAGVAVYKFSNGAPTREEIVKCLRWSENEWTTKSSGKRLYPGLIGI